MSIKRHSIILILTLLSVLLPLVYLSLPVDANVLPQQPTASMPTVTGTPTGPMVMVLENGQEQFVNVRSGPGPFYPKIGVLLVGQKAPAIGKSAGGDYIIIRYEGVPGNNGWVYASYVTITGGGSALPIVEPPPTP
ncbi:MAG: SH3 domain-containing protein, partial [Anaerolineae bacterium]|nr:SH3 domain-containing protein [Anaerolineae bacterium]